MTEHVENILFWGAHYVFRTLMKLMIKLFNWCSLSNFFIVTNVRLWFVDSAKTAFGANVFILSEAGHKRTGLFKNTRTKLKNKMVYLIQPLLCK